MRRYDLSALRLMYEIKETNWKIFKFENSVEVSKTRSAKNIRALSYQV